jgi:periplasmic divalent cation tolerance protein
MSAAEAKPAGQPSDEEAVVVLSTAPSDEVATKIAHALVETGLAACVNIVPGIRSVYRWKGQVTTDAELLLVVKTRAARAGEVLAAIRKNHPYEVPEAIALPILGGAADYLKWLHEVTS